ncbi:MAG TPA: MgtC/SapB family protein [Nitrolancea sp.]
MLSETDALMRILVAAALGAVLGIERELRDKPAGLRTHMLVAEGAALFMVGSVLLTQEYEHSGGSISVDTTRIASTIVAGIGFLGGGAILQTKDRVKGITTAAGIWVAAAIGLLSGAGFFVVAIGGTVIALLTLVLLVLPERWFSASNTRQYHVNPDDRGRNRPGPPE